MMAPEMAAEAMRAYAEETNRLNRERRTSGESHRSELAKIHRTLKPMLGVIDEGSFNATTPRAWRDFRRQPCPRRNAMR
jgi:site-specific DNA recombinase